MSSVLLGWILIVIGIAFLLLGIAAGIKLMFAKASGKGDNWVIDLIKALTEFVKALASAPQWLALTVVGLALVMYGSSLAF